MWLLCRYLQGRGNTKRHTMANPEEVHTLQTSGNAGNRTRRTGLLTVMERPPGNKINMNKKLDVV